MIKFHRRKATLLLCLAGLLCTFLAAWFGYDRETRELQALFEYRAREHAMAIERELAGLTAAADGALRTVAAELASPDSPTVLADELELIISRISGFEAVSIQGRSGPVWPKEPLVRTTFDEPDGIRCGINGSCRLITHMDDLMFVGRFSPKQLVEEALRWTPPAGAHVALQSWRGGAWRTEYRHVSRTGEKSDASLRPSVVPLNVSGARLRTLNIATPAIRHELPSGAAWKMGGGVALFFLLLVALAQKEFKLRESQERLADRRRRYIEGGHAMLDIIEIPITLVDTDFRYERANLAFARMHGIEDPRTIDGRHVSDIWGEESFREEIEPCLKRCFEGSIVERECEERIRGRRVWLETAMFPFRRDGAIEGAVVVTRDVTERKKAEQRKEQRLKAEARQMRLKEIGLLAGGVAHDLNNMLAVILGEAEIATMEDSTPPAMLEQWRNVSNTAERAARLCRQLLAYAGKGAFAPERLNPVRVVEDMRPMLELAVGKRVALEIVTDPLTPRIHADRGQIEQMLLNLVINAAEAIGSRQGRVSVRCGPLPPESVDDWPDGKAPSHAMFWVVEDDGPGISEDVLDRIFQPFFTTKDHGSGMGLAAVFGIVQALGGCIRAGNRPEGGARFTVALPALDSVATEEHRARQERRHLRELTGLVLLVDDDPGLRKTGAMALERMGLQVVTAGNGEEAVATFERLADELAAVVLDMVMPGMDGAEAGRRMRAMHPSVPIVLVSGHHDASDRMDWNPDAFIQKPYRLSVLRDVLWHLLDN